MLRIILFLLTILCLSGQAAPGACEPERLVLQIVRTAGEALLWEFPVKPGDLFMIRYRHSSDHTPVEDTFRIGEEGQIVLIEERYRWYGAGLESHPTMGSTDFSDGWTRVRMHRVMPRFLLRVGEVADHTLVIHGRTAPLLSITRKRESVWIRTMKTAGTR